MKLLDRPAIRLAVACTVLCGLALGAGLIVLKLVRKPAPEVVTLAGPALSRSRSATVAPRSNSPHGTSPALATIIRPPLTPQQVSAMLGTVHAPYSADENKRRFVMSLCRDLQGNLWAGCEADEAIRGSGGVWRYDPGTKAWTQFTTKDGLGDDNGYAVACDRLGRIWAGHLNHGVSVYNGQKWQCYEVVGGLSRPDTLSGPLGERIFHITVNQKDGDVWICSSAGLARYSESKDTWQYYTRAEGLPSDQANSIAFDKDGNIFVATQCDGIAMADAADDYAHWRTVSYKFHLPDGMSPPRVPLAAGSTGAAVTPSSDVVVYDDDTEPVTPTGDGLPSNLLNDILVASDGTVYAATDAGLAWSKDSGKSWKFVRGADWADKVRGLYGGPPVGWKETVGAALGEDYSTCCTESNGKHIIVGHRNAGRDTWGGELPLDETPSHFITCAIANSMSLILGTYGDSILATPSFVLRSSPSATMTIHPLPSPSPTSASTAVGNIASREVSGPDNFICEPGIAYYLGQDWRTEGNWIGRYGRHTAVLAALCDKGDYVWGAGDPQLQYRVSNDSRHFPEDSIRYWCQWLYTNNKNSLELPPIYRDSRIAMNLTTTSAVRRQSEWDDHGEHYSSSLAGPDIKIALVVPRGNFRLAIYNFNKDGHNSRDRFRDYYVQLVNNGNLKSDSQALSTTTTRFDSHVRINNFWNGVYHQFFVSGPANLTLIVKRNHSVNTTLNALMVDSFEPMPSPYFPHLSSHYSTSLLGRDDDELNAEAKTPERDIASLALDLDRQQQSDAEYLRTRSVLANIPSIEMATYANAVRLFRMNLYGELELLERRSGLMPVRDIEQELKWNPQIGTYAGNGRLTISRYIWEHAIDQ